MAVLLILTKSEHISHAVPWSLLVAKAKKTHLSILWTQKASKKGPPRTIKSHEVLEKQVVLYDVKRFLEETDFPNVGLETDQTILSELGPDQVCIRLLTREHPQILTSTLGFIKGEKVDLVVTIRDPNQGKDMFMNQLMDQVQPELLILNTLSPPPLSDIRFVTTASRGSYVSKALRLAYDMVETFEGSLKSLYIEPDGGEDAEAVGLRQIQKNLASAKISSEQVMTKVILNDSISMGIVEECQKGECDFLLLGISHKNIFRRFLFGSVPSEVIKRIGHETNIGILREALPVITLTKKSFDRFVSTYLPQLDRQARILLFDNLQTGSNWSFDFVTLICLSSGIASFGLIQNSPAIVIGAMLVAPLMTPMIGAGLGLVQGNIRLVKNAAKSIGFGFLLALSIGCVIGLLTPMTGLSAEVLARGKPNLLDLFVASFSGMAAAFAIARPGLSGALPGVAIAAALVPPIASCGIALSMGEILLAEGAAALFGTNLLAIIGSAAATLYGLGARPDQKFTGSRVWARRTFISLIIGIFIIALPLALGIFGRFKDETSLTQAIQDSIPVESSLRLVDYEWKNDILSIQLAGPKNINQKVFQVMKNQLSPWLGSGQTLRVSSIMSFSTVQSDEK